MNQVGDQVQLMVAPIPSGSAIYSYVWDYWDGSSTATAAPFSVKVINIGGQPGTDELHFTCRPVAQDGQSVTLNGTITANNPPTIMPGVSISNNDGYFAYLTTLSLTAIDVDNDPISFAYYVGTTLLGTGTSAYVGNLDGTWSGNGTTVIQQYAGTSNHIDLVVAASRVVRCYVSDDRGGTSSVAFALRGEPNPPPDTTLTAGVAGVAFDATTPPSARIGEGQTVDFTVYVAPMPQHSVSFTWTFSGSENWTMPPTFETGTTSYLPNGGLQNTVYRNIDAEVVSSGTAKVATAQVRVTAVNIYNSQISYTDAVYPITLIANSAPSAVTIGRSVNGVPIGGVGPVAAGTKIEFAAAGTDADLDLLTYRWVFNQAITPTTLYLWGPKVLVDTTGYASMTSVQGNLTVTDRLGATLYTILPSTNIS